MASGDLFRYHQEQGTELGLLAKQYMDRGELVPDEVTIKMVLDRIQWDDCRLGFILDGFPRTLEQAQALDAALGENGVDCVLHIRVSRDSLVRRLSGRLICRNCQTPYHLESAPPNVVGRCDRCGGELYQRSDDQPDVVQRRLVVQEEQISHLTSYYSGQGKLQEVNGDGEIKAVSGELAEALSRCGPAR